VNKVMNLRVLAPLSYYFCYIEVGIQLLLVCSVFTIFSVVIYLSSNYLLSIFLCSSNLFGKVEVLSYV
jgi:hypothetical protein